MSEKAGRYLVVDTETTGLHPARHGLIELAAAALDGQLILLDTFQADVCPPEGVEYDPEALQINGFTLERIRAGISYRMICERFLTFLNKNFSAEPIVIGQFYPFDYAFLEQVFSTSGYRDGLTAAFKGNDIIDTKALANSINAHALLKERPGIHCSKRYAHIEDDDRSNYYPSTSDNVRQNSGWKAHDDSDYC